jgi:hypothetical protein
MLNRAMLALAMAQFMAMPLVAAEAKQDPANLGVISFIDPKGRFVILKTKKSLAKGHQFCMHAEAEQVLACTGVAVSKGNLIAVRLSAEEAKLLKVGMVSELKDLYIKDLSAIDPSGFVEVSQKKADLSKLRNLLFKEIAPPEPEKKVEPILPEPIVTTITKTEIKTVYRDVFGPKKGEDEFKKIADQITEPSQPTRPASPVSESAPATVGREITKIVEVAPKAKKQSLKIDLRYLSILSQSVAYNQLNFRTIRQESGSTDSLWSIKKTPNEAEALAVGMRLQWVINFKHLLLVGIGVNRHAPLIAKSRYDEQVSDYEASVEQSFQANHFYVAYGRKIPLLHWAYASWAGGMQVEDSHLAFKAHRDEKGSGIQQEIIAFGEYAYQHMGFTGMFDVNLLYKDFVFSIGFDFQWYLLTTRDEFQGSVVIPFGVNSTADPRVDLNNSLGVQGSNPGLALIFALGYEPY